MDQATLISLLNDIASDESSANGLFFTQDGQPTDRFLEALKEDLSRLPEAPRRRANEVMATARSPEAQNLSVSNQRHSTGGLVYSRDPISDDESSDSDLEDYKPTRKVVHNRSGKHPSVAQKRMVQPSHVEEVEIIPIKSVAKKKRKSVVKRVELPMNLSASAEARVDQSLAREKSDADEDLLVEKDATIKSLQLRVKGQLQSIRTLEAQLAESQQQVEIKAKLIVQLNNRIKASVADQTNRTEQATAANRSLSIANSRAADAKWTELVDSYKKQIIALTTKLSDETTKKHKAEERAKILREYADAAKTRTVEVESRNEELKATVEDLQQKLTKYRKNYRDIASDINSQRNELAVRDNAVLKQQHKVDLAEREVRQLRLELHKCLEDIKTLRIDSHHKADVIRNLQLQLDIHNERVKVQQIESLLDGSIATSSSADRRARSTSPDKSRKHSNSQSLSTPKSSSLLSRPSSRSRGTAKALTGGLSFSDSLSVTPMRESSRVDTDSMQWKDVSYFDHTLQISSNSVAEVGLRQSLSEESIDQVLETLSPAASTPEPPVASTPLTTVAVATPPSTNSINSITSTAQRLRAIAEKETDQRFAEKDRKSTSPAADAAVKADRLTKLYLRVASRPQNDSSPVF